jgi:hypothetical protein
LRQVITAGDLLLFTLEYVFGRVEGHDPCDTTSLRGAPLGAAGSVWHDRPFAVYHQNDVRTMPFDVVHYFDSVVFYWVLSNVGGKAGRKARFIADPVEPLSLPTRSRA